MIRGTNYLTVREAANKLGVGINFVYALVKTGELKASRLGPQSIRIREDEIERWADGGSE